MKFQDVARLTPSERSDYISAAATDLGLSELIVEKDFWVVWLLEHIFALSANLGPFTFKGGTSLSKGFSAIRRFSEDIDISVSRATLGFPDDSYLYEATTRNETQRRVERIREAVRNYTTEAIEPALRARIAAELSTEWALNSDPSGASDFNIQRRSEDPSDTSCPTSFSSSAMPMRGPHMTLIYDRTSLKRSHQ